MTLLAAILTSALATTPDDHPGLYREDQRGFVVQVWGGPTSFRWFDTPTGEGGAVETLVGLRTETGGWALRSAFAFGQSPEGVDLGRFDTGVRWEVPIGPVRLETGVSTGILSYSGATRTPRLAATVSGLVGVDIDIPVGRHAHILFGPRASWDLATARDESPTEVLFLVGPAWVTDPPKRRRWTDPPAP